MASILIIKTGSTFPEIIPSLGDFEHWVLACASSLAVNCQVVDVVAGAPLPLAESCSGIIVTGSHAMVTDNFPWSVALEKWLADAVAQSIPVLGICYGHQLLAKALGGVIDYHPKGPEIGCFSIDVTPAASQDALFGQLPQTFQAHLTHHQSVITLPAGAVILARNIFEPHQAFRVGRCAWGVQFHPEYSTAIMTEYVERQRAVLELEGFDCRERLRKISDTPIAQNVMRLFLDYCLRPTTV